MGKIRILGIAIIAALLLGLGASVAAQAEIPVSVSISAPDRVMPDSDFTATVDIGEVVDLNAVQYDVSFDPLVLRLDDITPGQIDGTEIPVIAEEISPGTYRVIQWLMGTVSGSGSLAVLHFHVIGSLGDTSPIDLFEGILSGIEGKIPATWVGDSVLVVGVTSVVPAEGDIDTTLTVTITGLGLTGATAVTLSGTGITATNVQVVLDTEITADLAIAADAPAGLRDVVVTVPAGPLTGTELFEVLQSFTLTAPSGISLGLMLPGATALGQSTTDGIVVTNVSTWDVSAVDVKATAPGYMNTEIDGSGTSLAALFQISADDITYADANVGITYTDANALPFYVSQDVALDDPVGSYSITITFTGWY